MQQLQVQQQQVLAQQDSYALTIRSCCRCCKEYVGVYNGLIKMRELQEHTSRRAYQSLPLSSANKTRHSLRQKGLR
jgi:hypothetical protein